jgi:hypothetical protein
LPIPGSPTTSTWMSHRFPTASAPRSVRRCVPPKRPRASPTCMQRNQRPSSEAIIRVHRQSQGHHQWQSRLTTSCPNMAGLISGNHLDHLMPKYGRAEGGGEQLEQVPLVIRMQLRDLAQISRRERERSVRDGALLRRRRRRRLARSRVVDCNGLQVQKEDAPDAIMGMRGMRGRRKSHLTQLWE